MCLRPLHGDVALKNRAWRPFSKWAEGKVKRERRRGGLGGADGRIADDVRAYAHVDSVLRDFYGLFALILSLLRAVDALLFKLHEVNHARVSALCKIAQTPRLSVNPRFHTHNAISCPFVLALVEFIIVLSSTSSLLASLVRAPLFMLSFLLFHHHPSPKRCYRP